MAIKSGILSTIDVDINSKKDMFGPYSGLYLSAAVKILEPGWKWSKHKYAERVWCSCGCEAAKVEDPYEPRCPKCGNELATMVCDENSIPGVKQNVWSGTIKYGEVVNENEFQVKCSKFTISPIFSVDSDPLNIKNLKHYHMDCSDTLLAVCKKDADGKIIVNDKHVSYREYTNKYIQNKLCYQRGFEKFWGNLLPMVCPSYEIGKYMHDDVYMRKVEINIFSPHLSYAMNYPNVFKPEYFGSPLYSDLEDIFSQTSVDGRKIPATVSLEEYLTKRGFPVDILPISWSGRDKLSISGKKLVDFAETSFGKVIFSRLADDPNISPYTINDIYQLYQESEDDKDPDETRELFLDFMKECVDQYGINEIISLFNHRYFWLHENGYAINSDNMRTRKFNSLHNPQSYRMKKMVDLEELLQKEPLAALKSIMLKND